MEGSPQKLPPGDTPDGDDDDEYSVKGEWNHDCEEKHKT
jgi:hypothetical protein